MKKGLQEKIEMKIEEYALACGGIPNAYKTSLWARKIVLCVRRNSPPELKKIVKQATAG